MTMWLLLTLLVVFLLFPGLWDIVVAAVVSVAVLAGGLAVLTLTLGAVAWAAGSVLL